MKWIIGQEMDNWTRNEWMIGQEMDDWTTIGTRNRLFNMKWMIEHEIDNWTGNGLLHKKWIIGH